MILEKEEVDERLSSPLNLLNRLKKLTNTEVVTIPPRNSISIQEQLNSAVLPPTIDELVENVEDKLATAKCYSGAKDVLASAITLLKNNIEKVDSPVQLSRIATDMGKIVNGFDENKRTTPSVAIPIIYRPVMLTENSFQIIQAND